MTIASTCELLQEEHLPLHQREKINRIARASAEMSELVQTFLQLARGSDNIGVTETSTLASIATEEYQRWQPLFKAKEIQLEFWEESENKGRYNPTLLRTIMSNLLRNALHYTDDGNVRLVLESGGFRVEDSGPGVSQDQHEEIFKPFVRGFQQRGEGLGLGLSLVKRVCSHQNWEITISNRDEGGCCFLVHLNNAY
jgi:signal transduction histidine kinase